MARERRAAVPVRDEAHIPRQRADEKDGQNAVRRRVVVARQQVVRLCHTAAAVGRHILAKVVNHRGSLGPPRPRTRHTLLRPPHRRDSHAHPGLSTAEARPRVAAIFTRSRAAGRPGGARRPRPQHPQEPGEHEGLFTWREPFLRPAPRALPFARERGAARRSCGCHAADRPALDMVTRPVTGAQPASWSR